MNKEQRLCDVAMGRIEADIVFKNANIVNVFTNEIYKGDIAILDDRIAGIGNYKGKLQIECEGKYLCPGLIDAHLHIESTMVTPCEFAKAVLNDGTTALVADPHEMVNVSGRKAVDYLLAAAEKLPIDLYVMLPSSVPATPFETNGADFTAEDIKSFIDNKRVLGLGEVMCFPEVINGSERIFDKLVLAKNKILDGHAPSLTGAPLQAYAASGIQTEHECISFEEAREKCRTGMKILIREGSAAKNMSGILPDLLKSNLPYDNFLLCTDDKHLDDIWKEGHISHCVRKAIALGTPPTVAIAMSTIHTTRTYGLKNLGAIAPGYQADLLILDDLYDFKISSVYKNGRLVTKEWMEQLQEPHIEESLLHTVHFTDITADMLSLATGQTNHVIEMIPEQILTRHISKPIPSEKGLFVPSGDYTKLCVIERHGLTGNIAVAPLKGFGLRSGAIATTVAHDSHNIIAAGDNDEDICLAVNHLKTIQGGYVIASEGKILSALPLPLFGLMSTSPGEETSRIIADMQKTAHQMGIPEYFDPFITLSFMALPVIPEIRLTDRGLFDSVKQRFL